MKEKFLKFSEKTSRFLISDWYIAIVAALFIVGWAFDIWIPVLSVISAVTIFGLFIGRDTRSVLLPLVNITFIVSTERRELNWSFAPILILVLLLFAGLIFNAVFYKRDFKRLLPSRIKGFHAASIALIVPFALGGVGSPYENVGAVFVALALVAVLAAAYTLIYLTLADEEKRSELPEYMLKILFATGIIVSVEVIIFFAKLGNFDAISAAISAKKLALGWGGPNNVAPVLSLTIPATLYFCIKKTKFMTPILTLIALAEYALMLTSGCRGAILFTTLALPAMILYVAVKTENKKAFCITISLAFAVAFALIAYFGKQVIDVLGTMLNKGLNSSGRDVLYDEAADVFKKWPAFGSGWDYKHGARTHDAFTPYWYHSTFFQILASMGVLGVLVFAAYYFWRYYTMFSKRRNPACLTLTVALLLFDLYGMVDTNFFGPTFFIILMLMTLVVEVNTDDNKCLAFFGKDPAAGLKRAARRIFKKPKKGGENPSDNDDKQN